MCAGKQVTPNPCIDKLRAPIKSLVFMRECKSLNNSSSKKFPRLGAKLVSESFVEIMLWLVRSLTVLTKFLFRKYAGDPQAQRGIVANFEDPGGCEGALEILMSTQSARSSDFCLVKRRMTLVLL